MRQSKKHINYTDRYKGHVSKHHDKVNKHAHTHRKHPKTTLDKPYIN